MVLVVGIVSVVDVCLGLNISVIFGCEVVGVCVGVQEGCFGGYIQGLYCISNVQGEFGVGVFGGGLMVDFYQLFMFNVYGQFGVVLQLNGNFSIYGGVGVCYGILLVLVEVYLEGGVLYCSIIIGGLIVFCFVLGFNYVWCGVNFNEISGGESCLSNISVFGMGGLNVDVSGSGMGGSGGVFVLMQCNVSFEVDVVVVCSVVDVVVCSVLFLVVMVYSVIYSNVSYDILVGNVNVNGNSVIVIGIIILWVINCINGELVSGIYSGVVIFLCSGCGWVVIGYCQNGE